MPRPKQVVFYCVECKKATMKFSFKIGSTQPGEIYRNWLQKVTCRQVIAINTDSFIAITGLG